MMRSPRSPIPRPPVEVASLKPVWSFSILVSETGEPFEGNELGWIEPRALDEDGDLLGPCGLAQYAGELAWPDRFDAVVMPSE
jgi:hypothetical protein